MRLSALFAAGLLAAFTASTQDDDPDLMQKKLRFETKLTKPVSTAYLLHLPKSYDAKAAKKWPLILFLHGAGERGADLAKVALHGPPKLAKQRQEFAFIIVSPQCPANRHWDNDALLALLDDVIATHAVDTRRVYLTGLSMGGFGTWDLGLAHPDRFAAIAPICGGGDPLHVLLPDPKNAAALKTLPIWAFHGAKDPVVGLSESERMVNAVKRAGGKDVQLTVYPAATHDSWSKTYLNPKLYEWFLAHARK